MFGFYAPAGTPADVVTRLNREINSILGTQAVKDRILAMGGEALPHVAGRVRRQGGRRQQALQRDHQGTQDSGGLK